MHESSSNRANYLLAAAQLTDDLPGDAVEELLDQAIREVTDPARSEADESNEMFGHPMGAVRINMRDDSRPAAAYLAARLARTPEQQARAKSAALSLVSGDGNADSLLAHALSLQAAALGDDLPYLMSGSWSLRCIAAVAWAKSDGASADVGERLAADPDPRVRRTLASALAHEPKTPRTAGVRAKLAVDVRFSVRRALDEVSTSQ